MSGHVIWLESYSIGNEQIDAQHRAVLHALNRLSTNLNPVELEYELVAIFQYMRIHFKDEENYMMDINYPHFEEHQRHHEELRLKLFGMLLEIVNDRSRLPGLLTSICKLILDHILIDDVPIKGWLMGQTL